MLNARSIFRVLAVAGVTAAATTFGGPPAQASGVGVASFSSCDDISNDVGTTVARCVSGTLTARVVPGTGTTRYVHFECVVNAVYDAASITMDECSLGGISAIDVPHTAPGSTNTQSGVLVTNAGVRLAGCVAATATWLLNPVDTSDGTCRVIAFDIV